MAKPLFLKTTAKAFRINVLGEKNKLNDLHG